ncbi:MAG: hypothetical protein JO097_13105 [Acidobacteriaceae bacterium]|nr:hypothetical protein [Acidobacteriaceae bacterium]
MHSTSALLLSSKAGRLFLTPDCQPGRGPCIPGTPVLASDYVDRRYQDFRESGFIDLDSDMRLRVVGPIMRPGTEGPPLIASASSRSPSGGLNMNVLASPDLLGYESAIYALRPTENGIAATLISIDVKPIAGSAADLRKTDYLRLPNSPQYLRLYFQLQRSDFDHNSALLTADSLSALDQVSRRFEKDPSAVCAATAGCITLPRGVVMIPELAVHVRERTVYVALESNLQDALRSAGEHDARTLVKSLRISRRLGTRQVPIRFDRTSDEVLGLPLIGGDQITW